MTDARLKGPRTEEGPETVESSVPTAAHGEDRGRRMASILIPVVAVAVLVATLAVMDPAAYFASGAPPVEEMAFEAVTLKPGVIELVVRNAGPDPITVAQVLVDDAYWMFDMQPSRTLERLDSATITLQYPWVEGEAHAIMLLSESGASFDHEIAVAVETPSGQDLIVPGIVLGLVVGILPIAAGMLWFPFMRSSGPHVKEFALALAIGVLFVIGASATFEGFEAAEEVAASLHPDALMVGSIAAAFLLVLLVDRVMTRRTEGVPATGMALAYAIAAAIGLHNLGEGLAIAGAYAAGAASLGTLLFLGFAIHNVTEGPAVVAPLARGGSLAKGAWKHFVALGLVAGGPVILGAWLGGFATSPVWGVVVAGVGAGAAFVVIAQVWGQLRLDGGSLARVASIAGVLAGVVLMYATSLLV